MKNLHTKSIQIGGYLRIIAVSIAIIATLILGSRAYAIAPHMPDIALQKELDHHRQSTEDAKNRKASDKVNKHKEHKENSKGKKGKSKEKKPPKPSKKDKKNAAKDRAKTLNKK